MVKHEKFDLKAVASKAHNFLTTMVDDKYDFLPYWKIQIDTAPAHAFHVRVDDAELVASWYEAIVCVQKILGKDPRSEAVKGGFVRHLMKSWGPKGLRFHEDYPWSNTNHSAFHEMAYILGALNRLLEEEPGHPEAEKRTAELVRGMRELVVQRKIRTFWSGDYPFESTLYEFPNDVYMREGGWVPERCTGRGEESIRNAMMLHSLVVRAEKFNDEAALDLAEGIANHMLSLSRYFNYKGEYFGHVHSAIWFASGLARLARLTGYDRFRIKANQIYQYTHSISSSFGWVPEYAQWFAPGEVKCETCCIKDMIQCSLELIDNGYDYWNVVNNFVRNQLAEQQVQDGSFVNVDNSLDDTENGKTYRDLDRRIVGGWSGGAEPNSINLSRFRSIAGCCVGTAPQALHLVWERVVQENNGIVQVNLPIEKDGKAAKVEIGYPNRGEIKITAKKSGKYLVRAYEWMGQHPGTKINGKSTPLAYEDGCMIFENVKKGDVLSVEHRLDQEVKPEQVYGRTYHVTWKGPDVVRMDPAGMPLALYQRMSGMPKVYPNVMFSSIGDKSMKPTEQK